MPYEAKFRESATAEVAEEFRRLTSRSAAHWARWREVVPDWNERSGSLAPYPVYARSAHGARVIDLDDRELVDFVCANMGALLGHAPQVVEDAVRGQLARGTNFSLSPEPEARLAEMLVERIPSVERVRFTATGSEATMYALRVARAATGRSKIAKMDGGYHGSHDAVWFGSPRHPRGVVTPGIVDSVRDDVILLDFNDLDRTDAALRQRGSELAAVIVEPVLGAGGCLEATPEYLQLLRDRTTELGVVLIFDEMICLGAARGGVQELRGITPDLTTAGKTLSGGLPMAFYGGRADLMAQTASGPDGGLPRVEHVGTYMSLGLSMAAGIASLGEQTPDLFDHLSEIGGTMRARLSAMAARRGFPMQVLGINHLWGWFWTDEPVHTYADVRASDRRVPAATVTALLNRGVFAGAGRGIVNAAHSDRDIDTYVEMLEASLDHLLE